MFNLSFFVVAGMFPSSLGSQSKNHRLEDFVLKAPRVTFLEDTADWDVRGRRGGGKQRKEGGGIHVRRGKGRKRICRARAVSRKGCQEA